MLIDRQEILGVIEFIAAVIPDTDETGKNCLFVRVEDDRFIFTGGSEFTAKKVVLLRANTTEEAAKELKKKALPKTFMIPKGTLQAFETMMKKHKAKAKKMAKNDQSYLYVDIDDKELESFGNVVTYPQPSYQFKNLEPLFEKKREPVGELPINRSDLDDIMRGFSKSKQITTTFSGDGGIIHFHQKSTGYEAILIPPFEDDEGGDEK